MSGTCTFDEAEHVYRIDGTPVPSVTQVLALAGLEGVYTVDPVTRAFAAQKGTLVHLACQWLDEGKLNLPETRRVAPELMPYVDAYRRFRAEAPFKSKAVEERLWSKSLGVAGTLDRRGEWEGRETVVDLKTGKTLRWTMGVQLAGYVVLHLVTSGVELGQPMRTAFGKIGRKVVKLAEDGSYEVVTYDAAEDLDTFVAALTITQAKLRHGRGMLPFAPEGELEGAA